MTKNLPEQITEMFSNIEGKVTKNISLDELERRLRPQNPVAGGETWSDYSSEGFLAPNQRLLDVLESDYLALQTLERTYPEMAELAAIVLKEKTRFGPAQLNLLQRFLRFFEDVSERKRIDDKEYSILNIGSGGFQTCPWGCEGKDNYEYKTTGCGTTYVMLEQGELPDDEDFRIEDLTRTLAESSFLVVTDLTPHLIASHYFFEGETPYRTDPERLVRVFDVKGR